MSDPGTSDSGGSTERYSSDLYITDLYMGLMSGTSMDGIDAALVSFGNHSCEIIASGTQAYPEALRTALLHASRTPLECTVDKIGELDQWIGECFRDAAVALLAENDTDPATVNAIGSHGQTIRHRPAAQRPFTLQIGDPNIIAAGTGITTVADFRRRDIAVGGEGAPLAPAFHHWLFGQEGPKRCVLNVGGIANVTILAKNAAHTVGFDTGPGNTLLDAWVQKNRDTMFDEDGAWAKTGQVSQPLLQKLLADEYFTQLPPKSTGFEYFNTTWLENNLSAVADQQPTAADVQATLAELSASTIAGAILQFGQGVEDVLVCGGGVHNSDLMQRLRTHLPGVTVRDTGAFGLDADWVEAVAFAWLAKRCMEGKPGNLPAVTGAKRPEILGAVYKRGS